MSYTFKHFLLSRFNLKPKGKPLASEDWMERRWQLFTSTCWNSVKHQSNQNFTWLMFFDEETRESDRQRALRFQAEFPPFEPLFISGAEVYNEEVVKAVKQRSGDGFSHVITTRLDNDDAIHEEFVDVVQSQFNGQEEMLIDLRSGYSLWVRARTMLAVIDKPFNPFMSLIEKNSPDLITVSTRNHDQWASFKPTHVIKAHPLWLQTIHGENKSSQFGHRGWMVRGGYLKRDLGLLASFHVDMDIRPTPSSLSVWVYNTKVWVLQSLKQVKASLKQVSGSK